MATRRSFWDRFFGRNPEILEDLGDDVRALRVELERQQDLRIEAQRKAARQFVYT